MDLRYGKPGNDVQLVLQPMLRNELNSDVACLTPTFEPVLQKIKLQGLFLWVVEPENSTSTNVTQKVTEMIDCKTARI